MLKGITLSTFISFSIFVEIVIEDSIFLYFDGICDFDLLSPFSIRFFFVVSLLRLLLHSEVHLVNHSFQEICDQLLMYFELCFLLFHISTSSANCAFVNPNFSTILREVVVSITGKECDCYWSFSFSRGHHYKDP